MRPSLFAANPRLTTLQRLLKPSLAATLSNSAGRVGVLHVYRLELAERPQPNQKVRLLFPAGAPKTDEESAAQLAAAAERGDAVLLPERVLHELIGDDIVQMQLAEPAGSEHSGTRALEAHSTRGGGSDDSSVQPLAAKSAVSAAALAVAEAAVPLSDALTGGGGVVHPDWRTVTDTGEDESATASHMSDEQHGVLAAAASAKVTVLAEAIATCPGDELRSAALMPSGASALHLASTAGSLPAVKLLLEAGVSVHAQASNGSTALHWAAGSGHASVVQALLAAGASTRVRSSTWRSTVRGNDSGQTAAHWAAASGHSEALELLLAEDPHALLLEDEREMTLATLAARDGHPWLQAALDDLKGEKVVCVRIAREATLQRPLTAAGGSPEEEVLERTALPANR